MEKVKILDVPFSKMSLKETTEFLVKKIEYPENKVCHVVTANPETVMQAQRNPHLLNILQTSDCVTPDGIGIVLASRWFKNPLPERVAGYDLLMELLKEGNQNAWSFYFLGSSEEINARAVEMIQNQYPRIKAVGQHHGYFGKNEENILSEIEKKQPDVLVVALGVPRQEQWIVQHKHRINSKIAIGVGGSLDVIAGKVKRAPFLWRKLNLEWLYRLLSQPQRWKRQLDLPRFAFQVLLGSKIKKTEKSEQS